jgi:hypothetical protein
MFGSLNSGSATGDLTVASILPGLTLALVLAGLAFVAPIAAYFGAFMPEGRQVSDWFMRSGAITAVFAFAAQEQASNALELLSPRGFGSLGINKLRQVFVRPLNLIKRFIFWLAIAGSLIWAYGDLAYIRLHGA